MSNNTEQSLKSFWQRPEGKPGAVVLAALIGVGGFFLYKALPTIIELLQNTLYAIGLGAILFAVIALLMNDKFRTTIWYAYKGIMRWFTGMVIELNPIAILESYIEEIKGRLRKMDEQLQSLKGQIGKIQIKLDKNKADWQTAVDRMNAAQRQGKKEAFTLESRQAGRLEEHVKKLESLHSRMEVLYKVLSKMKYYSEIMVKDTENEVAIRKDEREAITKSYSVMKSAMSIIKGNDEKRAIFDQAMEFVVNDIGSKIGEMDRMLEASTDFISSVDLDNAVYEERGLKMLEEIENKGMDAIFGKKDAQALPQGNVYNTLNNFTQEPIKISNGSKSESGSNKKYF
jgi:hypothetical protein